MISVTTSLNVIIKGKENKRLMLKGGPSCRKFADAEEKGMDPDRSHPLRESTSPCVDASSVQQVFTVDHGLNSEDKIMACSNTLSLD